MPLVSIEECSAVLMTVVGVEGMLLWGKQECEAVNGMV